jgi:hypothetical protein
MRKMNTNEVDELFKREVIGGGRVSPFAESILKPVTEWLNSDRRRTREALAFDSEDGVTPANANALLSAIRKAAKDKGHAVRMVVKNSEGGAPKMTERKFNEGQSLVLYVKFLGAYVPRAQRNADEEDAA